MVSKKPGIGVKVAMVLGTDICGRVGPGLKLALEIFCCYVILAPLLK